MVNVFGVGGAQRQQRGRAAHGLGGWIAAIPSGLIAGAMAFAIGAASLVGVSGLLSMAASQSYSSLAPPAQAQESYDPYAAQSAQDDTSTYATDTSAPPADEYTTDSAAPAAPSADELSAARAAAEAAAAEPAYGYHSIGLMDLLRVLSTSALVNPFLFGILLMRAFASPNTAWRWAAGVGAFVFGPISETTRLFVAVAETQTTSFAVIAPGMVGVMFSTAAAAALIPICALLSSVGRR